MTRRGLALGIVVLAVLVGVGLAAYRSWHGTESLAAGARPLVARRDVQPRHQVFGDPAVATVDVIADRTRIDEPSIHLDTSFEPYEIAGPPVLTRRTDGPLLHLRWRFRLRCLTTVCVPDTVQRAVDLAPATVTFLRADGRPGRPLVVKWPRLTITSRLERGMLPPATPASAFGPPLTARVQPPPPPSYRISPSLLRPLLFAAALALIALAVLLLVPLVRRRVEPEPEPVVEPRAELTPLERALVGLDWARGHAGTQEQRKALELLSEELDADGEPNLAEGARSLAWSPRPPGEDADELSDRVREIVDSRAAERRAAEAEVVAVVAPVQRNGDGV